MQLLSDRMRWRNETHRNTRLFSPQLWTNYQIRCRGIHINRCLMTPEPVQTTLNCQKVVHHELDCILIFQEPQSDNWDVSWSKALFIGASHTEIVAFKISSMVNANQSEKFWRVVWADRTKTIQTDLSGQSKTDKCISAVFKCS